MPTTSSDVDRTGTGRASEPRRPAPRTPSGAESPHGAPPAHVRPRATRRRAAPTTRRRRRCRGGAWRQPTADRSLGIPARASGGRSADRVSASGSDRCRRGPNGRPRDPLPEARRGDRRDAFVLVTIGVVVRATDSGRRLPGLAGCFHGQFLPGARRLPRPGSSGSTGRWRSLIGFGRRARRSSPSSTIATGRSILWPIARRGRPRRVPGLARPETVRLGNSGESVTAHLATAMSWSRCSSTSSSGSCYPARIGGRGGSQRFTLLAAFAAARPTRCSCSART